MYIRPWSSPMMFARSGEEREIGFVGVEIHTTLSVLPPLVNVKLQNLGVDYTLV